MAITVDIENRTYFVSMPGLADVRNFQDFLHREHRRKAYAAIPEGIDDTQFKRWVSTIDEQCEAINVFESFPQLVEQAGGVTLLFHAMLRQENNAITMEWVKKLVERAESGDEAAVLGFRNLKEAFAELLQAKKNASKGTRKDKKTARRKKKRKRSTSTKSR